MSRTLFHPSLSFILVAAAYISLANPTRAMAQDQPVTFNISLTYNTTFENIIPSPLSVQPSSACSLQNVSTQVFYDAPHDQVTYHSTATIGTYFLYARNNVLVDCAFTFFGAASGLYVGDLSFSLSSGQILAECVPQTSYGFPTPPVIEIAHLIYIDKSNPGHSVYHFRGNDALFSIAQEIYGINFAGVELTFDVQAPSS